MSLLHKVPAGCSHLSASGRSEPRPRPYAVARFHYSNLITTNRDSVIAEHELPGPQLNGWGQPDDQAQCLWNLCLGQVARGWNWRRIGMGVNYRREPHLAALHVVQRSQDIDWVHCISMR